MMNCEFNDGHIELICQDGLLQINSLDWRNSICVDLKNIKSVKCAVYDSANIEGTYCTVDFASSRCESYLVVQIYTHQTSVYRFNYSLELLSIFKEVSFETNSDKVSIESLSDKDSIDTVFKEVSLDIESISDKDSKNTVFEGLNYE